MIFYAILTFFTTILGGLFALRTRGKHQALFGLSAGIILGVVFFDIVPELVELSSKLSIPFKIASVWIIR